MPRTSGLRARTNDTKHWTGIARHGAGYRATVSQGRGRPLIQQHFPIDTDLRVMQAWRADTRAELRVTRKQRATMGSFEFDARRYKLLKSVQKMPTYRERCREVDLWIAEFGTQPRHTITPVQIDEVKMRWLEEPRAPGKPPLSSNTVNKRLRALSNIFRRLDPSGTHNPVKDVEEAPESEQDAKHLDYETIEHVLELLPDVGRAEKGQKQPTVSKSKIRLRCFAYCPITPIQMKRLTPADLNLEAGLIRLPARKKGRGAKAVWLLMLPQARAAFAAFQAEHLYGHFSQSSLRKAWKAAARRAGVPASTPYQLRHSFATMAYEATGSREDVGLLLQHARKSTTAKYTKGAEGAVLEQIIAVVAQRFGITDVRDPEILLEFLKSNERPLVKQPTHSKGGNRHGRPGKRLKSTG